MKLGFIVTSAINTKFGVFNVEKRLEQTLVTIYSIHGYVEDPYIVFIEMAGEPLTPSQKADIQPHVNVIVDFSNDANVKAIYQNPNWDIVKSSTEIMCFQRTLEIIKTLDSAKGVDRWVKLSGRYRLVDEFDDLAYNNPAWADKCVFAQRRNSQFPEHVTGGVKSQFMSRCWSFPADKLSYISSMFFAMSKAFRTTVECGGYLDIEHLLYLYLPEDMVVEVDKIGVMGLLGPTGQRVVD